MLQFEKLRKATSVFAYNLVNLHKRTISGKGIGVIKHGSFLPVTNLNRKFFSQATSMLKVETHITDCLK